MTTVITINFKDLSLKQFASRKDAAAEGNDAAIIDSEEKLLDSRFTNAQFASIYNSLQGPEGQVKKFSDRESAVRRTYIAMRAHFGEEVPKKEKAPKEKAAGKAKGEKKSKTEKVAKPKKEKAPRAARGNFKVKAIGENPFRVGTKSHTNFQKVIDKPGKTFAEYVVAGVHAGILAHAIRLGHAKKIGAEG